MTFAHVHHRLDFLDAYMRHRYAFPERTSQLVEEMEARERALLDAYVDRAATGMTFEVGGRTERLGQVERRGR
jgi:hypothetical protein